MTFSKTASSIILFAFLTISAEARQTGGNVFKFLELSGDARSAALGGSHAAYIHPEASQFVTNPALLSSSDTKKLYLSYLNHIGDIRFGTASYAHEVSDIGIFSASIRFLNYGKMDGFDEFGNEQGSASSNDIAFSAGYSAMIAEDLSYGIALSGIHSSIAGYSSSAVSFSGGLLYNFPDRETSAGLYLNNAGTQLSTFNGVSEPLPLNIAAGVVHRLQYIPVRIHITFQRLNEWNLENTNDPESLSFSENLTRHFVAGSEFLFGDRIRARIGYDPWLHGQAKTGKRVDGAGLSLGIAIQLNHLNVDFSRTSFSDLGSVVQLGVGIPI